MPVPAPAHVLWLLVAAMAACSLAGAPVLAGEWLAGVVAAGAAGVMVRTARLRPDSRPLSTLIAAGAALYALGSLLWALGRTLDPGHASPSIADPLWLAFYVFALAALVRLLRGARRGLPGTLWLDVATAALAVAAVAVEWVAVPSLRDATGSQLAIVVNGAHPSLDVLVAAALAAAAVLTGWHPAARLAGLGFALFLAADALYFGQVAAGTLGIGWLPNILWSAGLVVFAHGVGARIELRDTQHPGVALPASFALVALSLLFVDHYADLHWTTAVLATLAVAAALVRLVATVHLERALHANRRLALTDELTGLPNRRALTRALERRLDADEDVALVLLDLDGFKEVNDSLGHVAGDELLPAVGRRLQAVLGQDEVLARLGGDEFAAVLPVGRARERAATMLEALGTPFEVTGVAVHVGASAGVAWSPDHGTTPFELLRRADEAMYRAKGSRGTVAVAADADDADARRRVGLLGELGAAIRQGEVVPHFQPQVDADGHVVGVEALARWEHPVHGLLPPALFLPGRAQGGLGRALTRAIVAAAAEHAAAWRALGHEVPVAVNLCAADLADDALAAEVAAACARHGLPAAALRLEVTETIVMADAVAGVARLEQLRAAGIGLALDDFGTERSSLAYLDAMPVDELKIDRAFVGRLDQPRTAAIVASTVELAQRLGLRTVAEGVETAAQRDALCRMGVDAVQGWLLSRPVPAAELLARAGRRRLAAA